MKGLLAGSFVPIMAGLVLGIINYAGLWLTVRNIPHINRPALAGIASFLLRSAIVLVGFYLVMDGGWDRLVLCAAAFLSVRLVFVRHYSKEDRKMRIAFKGN